ncbi:MAG: hypothetical protein A2017_11285 [Lentisphaerae bacterium GWF2_44_16]|nr:MAG: hypothetical protein A2017_11285 [Lentisphaerae bacterium GWF2_44_16]
MINNNQNRLNELRSKAESFLRQKNSSQQNETSLEDQKIIYELELRQVELEIQNQELEEAQKALKLSKENYFNLFDMAPVGYLTINKDCIIYEANLMVASLFKIDRKKILEKSFLDFVDDSCKDTFTKYIKDISQKTSSLNIDLKKNDGTLFGAQIAISSVHNLDFSPENYFVTIIDISSLKQSEDNLKKHRDSLEDMVNARTLEINMINEKLKREISEREKTEEKIKHSVAQKELLLREIHHRVKNNLSIVSGLLKLYSHKEKDEKIKNILKEIELRIDAMMFIHDRLYISSEFDKIPFDVYLDKLITNISSSFNQKNIKIKKFLFPATINSEKALSCGLIINELITNCYKHAFPNGREGYISIAFSIENIKSQENQDSPIWHLSISDNGVGLPKGFSVENNNSLGMNIIMLLSKQMKASVKISASNGLSFNMTFSDLSIERSISEHPPLFT